MEARHTVVVTAGELIEFEEEVAEEFRARRVSGPIHLSGNNEHQLIEVFKLVRPGDYCFSTYRSHYHALLKGIPRAEVMAQIMAGRSMNLSFPEHRFLTSAIVAGCAPIAVGVAAALKRQGSSDRVWCFLGDMAASIGAVADCQKFARRNALPCRFVIEDNGMSCDSPTPDCWGTSGGQDNVMGYRYERKYPHVGIGEFIKF